VAAQDQVSYPDGYRRWVHVKSTIVGPDAPGFVRNGGIHHYYANPAAVEGYRDGVFADGSILVDEHLDMHQAAPGVTDDGPRRKVSVMVRNAARFPGTGGWGFEEFPQDSRTGVLSDERRAACAACHAKGRGGVMTQLQP